MRCISLLILLSTVAAATAATVVSEEQWFSVTFSGVVVGVGVDRFHREDGVVYYSSQLELQMTRLGDEVKMVSRLDERDGADLRPLAFSTELLMSGQRVTTEGEMIDDTLRVTRSGGGVNKIEMFAWEPGAIGMASVDDMVTRQLRAGASDISIRTFDPQWVAYKTMRFVVRAQSDGELRVVDQYENDGETPIMTAWYDEDFKAVRSVMNMMGIEIVMELVSSDEAAALELDPGFDIILASMIPCDGFSTDPREVERLTLMLTFDSPAGANAISDGPTQKVQRRDGALVFVDLERESRDASTTSAAQLERYLMSDIYIQSEDPRLAALADSIAAATGADGRDLVGEMAAFVDRRITDKNYEHGFSSAVEAYQSREGDCTEHAVLLTALLRAADIPARSAVGLVYDPSGYLVGHMWVEAYVDGWMTVDALDLGTNPVRLRISVSQDERGLRETEVMNAYSVLGGIDVRIVDIERRR